MPCAPVFRATRRSRSWISRSGTKYGLSCCLLSSPIWRAACPRWLRRWRICSSRSLILDRQSSRSIEAPDADLSANLGQYRRSGSPAQVLEGRALRGRERARLAHGQRSQVERSELHPAQPDHRVTEGLAVALPLPVAPLGERELDPRRARRASQEADGRGHGGAVGQHDPASPATELTR